MKLQSLVRSLSVGKLKDIELSGIKLSSKNVRKGDLFICLPDIQEEKREIHIEEALYRGASCIIKPEDKSTVCFDNYPIIETDNVRKILSEIASNMYPNSIDTVIGVTGTCGKTSTVSFIRQLLTGIGYSAGSLGTLGVWMGNNEITELPRIMTTPPILHLYYILHYLYNRGVSHFAMEVTSQGLHKNRVDYVPFKAGLFTNFSPSHLDYHKDMDHYFDSKKRFFSEVLNEESIAVINSEQKWSSDILNVCKQRNHKTILIGKDIRLESSSINADGTEIVITYFGEKKTIFVPFPSTFQNENLLFAIGALTGIDVNIERILTQIMQLSPIEGRMELVKRLNNGAAVMLDYAHRPETFEKMLEPFSHEGREIVLVFGCGGGGYKDRRKVLGSIAQKYARKIFITDDNARDEDPAEIRKMILEGCPQAIEISDRKLAILTAMKSLRPNDICIVAGRGSETIQVIGKNKFEFSDKKEILNALKTLEAKHEQTNR